MGNTLNFSSSVVAGFMFMGLLYHDFFWRVNFLLGVLDGRFESGQSSNIQGCQHGTGGGGLDV